MLVGQIRNNQSLNRRPSQILDKIFETVLEDRIEVGHDDERQLSVQLLQACD